MNNHSVFLLLYSLLGIPFVCLGALYWCSFDFTPYRGIATLLLVYGVLKMMLVLFFLALEIVHKIKFPDYSAEKEEEEMLIKIRERVSEDLKAHAYDKSCNRYQYLIEQYPNRMDIRDELALIYNKMNKPAQAGKVIYFKIRKTELENNWMNAFNQSLGNSPFLILKNTINHQNLDETFLIQNKIQIQELIDKVGIDSEKSSYIMRNLIQAMKKLDQSNPVRLFHDMKYLLIEIIILTIFLSLYYGIQN